MGIFKQDSYGVTCDGCNEIHEGEWSGWSLFGDQDQATESAYDDDWREIRGKWYCPECVEKMFHYDEELDDYVPNNDSLTNK